MIEFPCGCKISETGIDFNNLPDCSYTWDTICEGKTKGVFQLESGRGKSWAARVKPRSIEELSDLIAILHPTSALGGYPTDKSNEWLKKFRSDQVQQFGAPFGIISPTLDFLIIVSIRNFIWRYQFWIHLEIDLDANFFLYLT